MRKIFTFFTVLLLGIPLFAVCFRREKHYFARLGGDRDSGIDSEWDYNFG